MLQTAPVTLLVGRDDPVRYAMANGLLRRRSRVIAAQISALKGTKTALALEDVSTDTFDAFFFWSHQHPPRLPTQMTLERALDVARMAEKYQIAGLENAVSDLVREQLRMGRWKVDIFAVNSAYEDFAKGSPVRELVCLVLNQCVRRPGCTPNDDAEMWLLVANDFPELFRDFMRLSRDGWPSRQIEDGGVCRFHHHRVGRNALSAAPNEKQKCVFALDEWYPAVDSEDVSPDREECGESEMISTADIVPEEAVSHGSRRANSCWDEARVH